MACGKWLSEQVQGNGPEAVLLYEGETLYDWRYVDPLYVNEEQE